MPHMEAQHEADGLRFWNGDPTVRLIEADDELGAMLLERCEPGTSLRELPEPEQDVVLAKLLHRIWRTPPAGHSFRPLSEMIEHWIGETLEQQAEWADEALVRSGIFALRELAGGAAEGVLLATDLHAGNVLRAEREPWLVIDPKPFVGDPAYDATQHLLNCDRRLVADPNGLVARLAELLEVDRERVRLWTFARCALRTMGGMLDELPIARALAP
jgi:streptomycin 6-kinase